MNASDLWERSIFSNLLDSSRKRFFVVMTVWTASALLGRMKDNICLDLCGILAPLAGSMKYLKLLSCVSQFSGTVFWRNLTVSAISVRASLFAFGIYTISCQTHLGRIRYVSLSFKLWFCLWFECDQKIFDSCIKKTKRPIRLSWPAFFRAYLPPFSILSFLLTANHFWELPGSSFFP